MSDFETLDQKILSDQNPVVNEIIQNENNENINNNNNENNNNEKNNENDIITEIDL
jgi:hypothetical protein